MRAASVAPQQAVAEAPGVDAPPVVEPEPLPEPEPEPEPEPPSDADQALEVLRDQRRAMTTSEVSQALGMGASKVLRVMNELSAEGLVKKDKLGSSNVYWHPDYDLSPQEGVDPAVIVAKLQIAERQARTAAEETLAGFFSKTEKIADTAFEHHPLWQIEVNVERTTGLIFKETTEAKATLYVDARDGRVCSYHPSKGFSFSDVVDEDPLALRDLDDVCSFEEKMPGELNLDGRMLEGLLEPDQVRKLIERKYIAKATDVNLVLLPYWLFQIDSTDGSKSRELILDGIVGKPMEL